MSVDGLPGCPCLDAATVATALGDTTHAFIAGTNYSFGANGTYPTTYVATASTAGRANDDRIITSILRPAVVRRRQGGGRLVRERVVLGRRERVRRRRGAVGDVVLCAGRPRLLVRDVRPLQHLRRLLRDGDRAAAAAARGAAAVGAAAHGAAAAAAVLAAAAAARGAAAVAHRRRLRERNHRGLDRGRPRRRRGAGRGDRRVRARRGGWSGGSSWRRGSARRPRCTRRTI